MSLAERVTLLADTLAQWKPYTLPIQTAIALDRPDLLHAVDDYTQLLMWALPSRHNIIHFALTKGASIDFLQSSPPLLHLSLADPTTALLLQQHHPHTLPSLLTPSLLHSAILHQQLSLISFLLPTSPPLTPSSSPFDPMPLSL